MFRSSHDLTLKNVWIMGQTRAGNLANYEPIKLLGDDKNYVFDNVIFDRNDWHHLGPDGPNSDFWITNCSFRNLFGPTQIWEGLGCRWEVGADTVIIENNTFFNIGFTPFQSEAEPVNYVRFNHNTLVNIGRSFQAGNIWKEVYVTNNLFVNFFWQGESEAQYTDPGRIDAPGFFGIGELPARFGTNFDRQILLANNAYYRDPRFDTFDASHVPPILPQPFISDTTQGWFDAWDNMVIENNVNVLPDLGTYITDEIINNMTQFIADQFAATPVIPSARYFWDTGRDETNFTLPNWPLPEDFSYTTASLLTAGTDGLPLGDLNWFPTDKATFEANKDAFVREIEDMTSAPTLQIVSTDEAETLALGGGATVNTIQGFTYYQMDGGGSLEWTFDLASGRQLDLNVWTHLRGNSQRGEHTFINGQEIWDESHRYGELMYDVTLGPAAGKPNNEWIFVKFTQADLRPEDAGKLTFLTGTNSIRITPSWGYQNFAGIDLLEPGTETIAVSLRAPDAVTQGLIPHAEEPVGTPLPWVPQGFKSVLLEAGGSLAVTVDAPYTGLYMLRMFFAAAGTAQGQVAVNGTVVVPSVTFTDTSDVFTDQFSMNQGTNTITLSSVSGSVAIDYTQVIAFVPTGVNPPVQLPEGFSLSQNYPNPFNPSTTIRFSLDKTYNVKLKVYNLLGQKVATLIDSRLNAGPHIVQFDAKELSTGVYFYRLEAGDFILNRRMLLIK
jgi:hypothetical protein